jgi:hypothetical protein
MREGSDRPEVTCGLAGRGVRFDNGKTLLTRKSLFCQTTPMPEQDIIANQKHILENQKAILDNQKTIQDNQNIIKQNQESLQLILRNQEKILALLQK